MCNLLLLVNGNSLFTWRVVQLLCIRDLESRIFVFYLTGRKITKKKNPTALNWRMRIKLLTGYRHDQGFQRKTRVRKSHQGRAIKLYPTEMSNLWIKANIWELVYWWNWEENSFTGCTDGAFVKINGRRGLKCCWLNT